MTDKKCEDCIKKSACLSHKILTGEGCDHFVGKDASTEKPKGNPKTAINYLTECAEVQKQRGEQYDSKGSGERSFAACATAYNAVTGRDLQGSDICLILQYLKDVRQYSDPTRLHEDSVLDKISYASLHGEELNKELLEDKAGCDE